MGGISLVAKGGLRLKQLSIAWSGSMVFPYLLTNNKGLIHPLFPEKTGCIITPAAPPTGILGGCMTELPDETHHLFLKGSLCHFLLMLGCSLIPGKVEMLELLSARLPS